MIGLGVWLAWGMNRDGWHGVEFVVLDLAWALGDFYSLKHYDTL